MILDDAESELLKTYITKLLEDVSDADSDVLADYVLALIKTDDAEDVAKPNCIDNLRDFLGERAESFVEQVFAAIAAKTYDPSRLPVTPVAPARSHMPGGQKRPYNEANGVYGGHGQIYDGGRPVKRARQSGRGGARGSFDQRGGRQQFGGAPFGQQVPQMPGMPPFDFDPSNIDPNNPMAGLLALQQAMGGMLPGGMPGFSMPGAPPPSNGSRGGRRCRDYDTKGFCARGASCNFEHGDDPYIVGNEEYDPNQATLLNVQPSRTGFVNTSSNGRGRGGQRGRGANTNFRGGGKRSDISHGGPNHDTSVTSVVVEQIPDDKFDEQSVRDFFGEFGNIENINMQQYKRLAVVEYEDYESAKRAYDSPKVIFDNRFVKVYWYKADALQKPPNGRSPAPYRKEEQEEEPQIDLEEIARKQEEAQHRHEEQKKQRENAQRQKEELEVRMKEIEAERRKMNEMLAKKAGKAAPVEPAAKENGEHQDLRETLAKLEAEAKSLGIDPNAAAGNGWNDSAYPPRGRGAYRGRGRGRAFNAPYRGGWAAGGGRGGGNVMRLDNRPKAVSVTFSEGGYEDHDEALRQWLLFNSGESTILSKHPDKQNAALIEFAERYRAENFMAAASTPDFPLAGKMEELVWHKPTAAAGNDSLDVKMAGTEIKEDEAPAREDVDDRDDEDRWG
ncbi:uncharacterized protein RCC_04855 [Ramularia collo-cygni]|uniref:Uncharacterized protein n=1 Tax=Ramularia collo-cygni TaxID=112498 RepID=A0A2D3V0J8_9PEZI|nr:uncharacterized protein RCC_04855 [Ramularia collo-cygni]CZT19010.1 uncharacterized protein RCC_04855 [Ramularia collo-cygni]